MMSTWISDRQRQRQNKYCSAEMKIDFKKQKLQQNNNTAVTWTDKGKWENIAGHIWQIWRRHPDILQLPTLGESHRWKSMQCVL